MTHPQRCESCQLHTRELGYDDMIFCNFGGGKTAVYKPVLRFINVRGCASHSSAPVPEGYIITDDERKKMLKLWSVIQQHIDWQHNACHTLDLTVQDAYNLMEQIHSRPATTNELLKSTNLVVKPWRRVGSFAGAPRRESQIRQDEREKVLDELRIIKDYDIIRFHQKHTLPKSWVEVRVTSVSKDGKRIGISGKLPGEGCTTEMCIGLSDVRQVCRWIELRKQEQP